MISEKNPESSKIQEEKRIEQQKVQSYWKPQLNPHNCNFHNPYLTLSIYLISFFSIIVSITFKTLYPYFFMFVLFLSWDILYAFYNNHFAGRDSIFILKQITTARTTMSYFLAIQVILLGSLIRVYNVDFDNLLSKSQTEVYQMELSGQLLEKSGEVYQMESSGQVINLVQKKGRLVRDKTSINRLKTMIGSSKLLQFLLIGPVIASVLAMLFIPIQAVDEELDTCKDCKTKISGPTFALKFLFFCVMYLQKYVIYSTVFLPLYIINHLV